MTLSRAMVMAAGRGERMRPLTDTCPKPLLRVHGKPLIEYHTDALARAGCDEVVINTAWLGEQLENHYAQRVGGPRIVWSHEGQDFGGALETAGGVARALPLLDGVFWLVAGDVFVPDFDFAADSMARFAASDALAHIWLVPNPPQHPRGDFALDAQGRVQRDGPQRCTYSTLGLYRQAFFAKLPRGNPQGLKAAMLPLMHDAIDAGKMSGEIYAGGWADVGTPQRLAQLNAPGGPVDSAM